MFGVETVRVTPQAPASCSGCVNHAGRGASEPGNGDGDEKKPEKDELFQFHDKIYFTKMWFLFFKCVCAFITV